MQNYMLLFVVFAALHAMTYSRWLMKNGNKTGAIGVYVLILLSLALPIYRMVTAL
ncbi:hypothetical protein SPFL3102_02387 [Sporomusaceae bacterium FL31]|nr:hypothetical protein SPFL3101_02197 [Sporomusaceae bacterium FL31]GCE34570.1 hypothetical protein SPFL3102_02387 [Sporomusaceae bacterium]